MKKFLIGMILIGTILSVGFFIGLLYNFVMLLQTLSGG